MACEFIAVNRHTVDRTAAMEVGFQLLSRGSVINLNISQNNKLFVRKQIQLDAYNDMHFY